MLALVSSPVQADPPNPIQDSRARENENEIKEDILKTPKPRVSAIRFPQDFALDVLWGKFILLRQSGIGWFCQHAKVGDKGLSDFFIRQNRC
jgi:hypothetical protein